MLSLREVFLVLLLAVGYLEVTGDGLSSGQLLWKVDIVLKEYIATADALRNITVEDTRVNRVQLASIVTTFLTDLMNGLNAVYITVPNSFGKEGYNQAVNITIEYQNFVNKIQYVIYEQPAVLKEKLAFLLVDITSIVTSMRNIIRCGSELICNQYDYALNSVLYGLVKLKLQVLHFKETNKQISARITSLIAEATIDMNIAEPQKTALVYLHHFGTLQETITLAVVNRMQKWIELNFKDTKNVKIAEEVINVMTDLIKREARAVRNLHTVDDLKYEQLSVYITGASVVKKLSELELAEDSVGYDYIGSTLMDAIAIPAFFSQLCNNMLKE